MEVSFADQATVAVALITVFVRPVRRNLRKETPCFTKETCVTDLLNGATLVPFFMLASSLFSKDIFQAALATNRVMMTIAGLIGLFYIIGEMSKT